MAAVDLGTNSVHLVVAKVDDASIEVLEREREMVRLGSSGGDMKKLSPDAMDRAVAALTRFRQVADIHAAPLRAVATSAVREAENRQVLLDRARAEAGVEVDVISGFEEARLIHLGALQAVPVFDRRMLLCDIGGGSTELVLGQRGEVLAARSFKLGAIRLTQRFFPGDLDLAAREPSLETTAGTGRPAEARAAHERPAVSTDAVAVSSCRRYVRATFTPFLGELTRRGYDVAVGSSGTIGAVCWMVAALRDEHQGSGMPRTISNFTMTRDEVGEVVERLIHAGGVPERATLPGLDPGRADIILAGALILEQVMGGLGIEELTFSDCALREGVLLDTWRRRHGGSLHHLSELRRRSVLKLMDLMDEDPRHSQEVTRLALQLFDEIAGWHGLGDDSREVLEAAALLCNIGLFVSHAGHHKHSYYIIRNSEQLTGFTDRELELIAQVARYHRKSMPKPSHEAFAALPPEDQERVRTLAGLLRVAIGLDRNHAGKVERVHSRAAAGGPDRLAATGERPLVIEVVSKDGEDVSLELYAASQRKDLLQAALGTTIDLSIA